MSSVEHTPVEPASRGRPSPVSVIIPAYNVADVIDECIDSFLEQHYVPLEVIVVDDGSTDETAALVEARQGIRLVATAHDGAAAARNAGARAAAGEILVFAEADATYRSDWIANLVAALGAGGARVGASLCGPGRCWTERANLTVLYQNAKFEAVTRLYESGRRVRGAWAWRRDIFWQLGGYDTSLNCGEDADLVYRLIASGYEVKFAPRSEMRHRFPEQLSTYLRRCYWNGHQSIWLRLKRKGPPSRAAKLASLTRAMLMFATPIVAAAATSYLLVEAPSAALVGWMSLFAVLTLLLVYARPTAALPGQIHVFLLTMRVGLGDQRSSRALLFPFVAWLEQTAGELGRFAGMWRTRTWDLPAMKGS